MSQDQKTFNINITTATIIKILLILLAVGILYLLRDVILILIVSVVLATALNPWVNSLQRKRVPRILATSFIFLIFFGSFIVIIVLLVPPIATQIGDIAKNFPDYYNRVLNDFQSYRDFSLQQNLLESLNSSLQSLHTDISKTTAGIFSAVSTIFGGFFSLIGVLVISFYMLLEEDALKKFLRSIMPVKYQPYVFQLLNRSQEQLRQWLKGQLILCLIVAVLAYIGLTILGVDYALVLALWAGLTEFIPIIGPILGGIPAFFIALASGNFLIALLVVIWYFVIQQLENNLIVPKVMSKTVGLNPLIVIVIMLIGAKLAGIVGLLLAVPLALIVRTFLEDFFSFKREEDNRLEG